MESSKIYYKMCANKSCCPVLEEVEKDKFMIKDDYDGKVVLTKEELTLLKNFLNTNLVEQ